MSCKKTRIRAWVGFATLFTATCAGEPAELVCQTDEDCLTTSAPVCGKDLVCRGKECEDNFDCQMIAADDNTNPCATPCAGTTTCVSSASGKSHCFDVSAACEAPLVAAAGVTDTDGNDVDVCVEADVHCSAPGRCLGGTHFGASGDL
jgi:hypothetical protein